ncbi:MAG: methylenetetrahydromethanopterin dehydrogenase [Gammaproteobacteria bacterium]|nr:methylenetetrahydromethanopterin dehydrogenase [Gammaproteobacteria bacterium]
MKDPYLLHIFSPTKYVSPFDINMAYEAHYDGVIPYCNVALDEIHSLTQDTIFSRSPEGGRRTGIFIGGRDLSVALDMLDAARNAMVPPFAVSVLADPSGAITTAAAMVALAERWLAKSFQTDLTDQAVYILGGTGPVGACVALLAAACKARVTLVSNRGTESALAAADALASRYNIEVNGVAGGSPAAIATILDKATVVFNTAKAGARVITAAALEKARQLRVAVDANAVPPTGIEGVGLKDNGVPLQTTAGSGVGIGALAVGDIKYRVHTGLLAQMHEASGPIYLAYQEAFELARQIVARR